jgi:hypothetical protein
LLDIALPQIDVPHTEPKVIVGLLTVVVISPKMLVDLGQASQQLGIGALEPVGGL